MQKLNIFLFTATLHEAKSILNLSNKISEKILNKIKIRTFEFNNRQIHLIITGIGQKKTKKTLNAITDFINNGTIINIGIAGALHNKSKIGDWFSINKIFSDNKIIDIECRSAFSTASILTSSAEVTNEETKQKHHKEYSADLVDMESYFIAELAKQKKLPCCVLKMVSDYANENQKSISELKEIMKIHYNSQAAKNFIKITKTSLL